MVTYSSSLSIPLAESRKVHAEAADFANRTTKEEVYSQLIKEAKSLCEGQRNWVFRSPMGQDMLLIDSYYDTILGLVSLSVHIFSPGFCAMQSDLCYGIAISPTPHHCFGMHIKHFLRRRTKSIGRVWFFPS